MKTIDKIRELCSEKGITVQTLEEEIGEKRTSVASATSNMKAEKLYKIASYFHVSMETIMCKPDIIERDPAAINQRFDITPFEYDIITAFRSADEIDRRSVLRILGLEEKETSKKGESA